MTILLGSRSTAACQMPRADVLDDPPCTPQAALDEFGNIETQFAKTIRAFERVKRDELKVATSAAQILMAILRHAALRDEPSD